MTSLLARNSGLRLDSEQDALDVIAHGLPGCIFTASELHPGFYDLSNGLAGAVFQKFANYGFRVAFIVPDDHDYGPRVTELIRDHANHPVIRFFATESDAAAWLA